MPYKVFRELGKPKECRHKNLETGHSGFCCCGMEHSEPHRGCLQLRGLKKAFGGKRSAVTLTLLDWGRETGIDVSNVPFYMRSTADHIIAQWCASVLQVERNGRPNFIQLTSAVTGAICSLEVQKNVPLFWGCLSWLLPSAKCSAYPIAMEASVLGSWKYLDLELVFIPLLAHTGTCVRLESRENLTHRAVS